MATANSGLFIDLKELIACTYDLKNNKFKDKFTGCYAKKRLSEDRRILIKALIEVIMTSDKLVSDYTKLYLSERYITIKGVWEYVNEKYSREMRNANMEFKGISQNSVSGKISADRRNLNSLIGEDFVKNITGNCSSSDLIIYSKRITNMYNKYGYSECKNLRNNLNLNLDDEILANNITDAEWENFIRTILPYIKTQMEAVASNIDKKAIGYYNYILCGKGLNDKDKERLKYLIMILADKDTVVQKIYKDVGINTIDE